MKKSDKKKLNLLFDATILTYYFERTPRRSGICLVAYNILQELKKRDIFNIILFLDIDDFKIYHKMKKDIFFKNFKYYVINNNYKVKLINNINRHKRCINKNIINSFILILKIIKNILVLFLSCIFTDNHIKIMKKIDICFSSQFHFTYNKTKFKHIKEFVILHDIIPMLIKEYAGEENFKRISGGLNKDTYYFCVSNNTKNDFIKYYSQYIDENKMYVTYNAAIQNYSPNYYKEELKNILIKYNNNYSINNKYLFSLCTLAPHKNLIFTIYCFIKFINKNNIKDLIFYLGGGQEGHMEYFLSKLKEKIPDIDNYNDKIIKLGYINDEDLNIIYSNALFFTFLSQYEGFGVPPLEAMQAGTPVITSNNSSIPEVVGDAAIMIDCNNEEQCIKAFEQLYFNEDLRNEYIKKGLERAKMFSWEKTVNNMCNIIKKIV